MSKPSSLKDYFEISFFIVVSIATIISLIVTIKSLNLASKEAELLNAPVVGVIDFQFTKFYAKGEKDTYDNIQYIVGKSTIKNVGKVPVKNFKFDFTWKIGNTKLPVTEFSRTQEGTKFPQGTTIFHTFPINKTILETMVTNKERLILTYPFSYSDWIGYKTYNYTYSFALVIMDKEPLTIQAVPLP